MSQPYISVLLDSQALTALAQKAPALQPWTQLVKSGRARYFVSTITLTESTDGSARDASVRRIVKTMSTTIAPTEDISYLAGKIRTGANLGRRKARDLTVDAIVVATAATLPPPAVILTSDPTDLLLLRTQLPITEQNKIDIQQIN